jgi:hypothetical protein
MKNFETLEVGKTYKNRNGKLREIEFTDNGVVPFLDNYGYWYFDNGDSVLSSQYDLIELIKDKPLTIDEINAIIAELEELRKELDKSVEVSDNSWQHLIDTRTEGEYAYKAFILHNSYNWELLKDSFNMPILVPTKKK